MPWEDTYADGIMYLESKRLDSPDGKGHAWKRDDLIYPDGYIPADLFAYEGGRYCNGPKCEACGYSFCHHCKSGPERECDRPMSDAGREAMLTLIREKRGS